jgi:hypothetical protein
MSFSQFVLARSGEIIVHPQKKDINQFAMILVYKKAMSLAQWLRPGNVSATEPKQERSKDHDISI